MTKQPTGARFLDALADFVAAANHLAIYYPREGTPHYPEGLPACDALASALEAWAQAEGRDRFEITPDLRERLERALVLGGLDPLPVVTVLDDMFGCGAGVSVDGIEIHPTPTGWEIGAVMNGTPTEVDVEGADYVELEEGLRAWGEVTSKVLAHVAGARSLWGIP